MVFPRTEGLSPEEKDQARLDYVKELQRIALQAPLGAVEVSDIQVIHNRVWQAADFRREYLESLERRKGLREKIAGFLGGTGLRDSSDTSPPLTPVQAELLARTSALLAQSAHDATIYGSQEIA